MADDGHEVAGQEFSGKTVEEATEEGLAQMGLSAAQAEIEVISRGSRGIFGIGSEPARVRIARRIPASPPSAPSSPQTSAPSAAHSTVPAQPTASPAPAPEPAPPTQTQQTTDQSSLADTESATGTTATGKPAPVAEQQVEPAGAIASPTAVADAHRDDEDDNDRAADYDEADDVDEEELARLSSELLQELIRHMGFACTISGEWRDPADDESDRYLHLDIHGNDLGALIGRRGETLASIQYLVRLMVNQRIRQWKPIVVDVENYKERRNNQLSQLALRMADQVVQSGRAMSLEPMPANERRIIHLTLRDHPEVYTQSSGEGERRKVHIVAKE